MTNISKEVIRAFDTKLPYGQELTQLLIQRYVSEPNIKNLLQRKGIFFGLREKRHSVPLLSTTLLTPAEFEYIKEKRNLKENNIKRRSTTLPWALDNPNKKLYDVFPRDINIKEVVPTTFTGYELVGVPKFRPAKDNKNKMIVNFEINRIDETKGWAGSKRRHKGSVEIELKDGAIEVNVTKYGTSQETEEVSNKIVSSVKKELINSGCIGKNELSVIFSLFTNEERIRFFWQLTGEIKNRFLRFDRITDIDVKPDSDTSIPKGLDIEWMANNIKRLHVAGDSIHKTFFITDKKCHPYLIIWRMEAKFLFDDHVAKGDCRLNFEFLNYGRTGSEKAELSIGIVQINLDKAFKHVNKQKVGKHLLEQIDELKTKNLKDFIEKINNNESLN